MARPRVSTMTRKTATEEFQDWLEATPRLPDQGVIAGVIAGLAARYGWNARLLRVLVVIAVLTVVPGSLFLCVYLALWYLLPAAGKHRGSRSASADGRTDEVADETVLAMRLRAIDRRLRRLEAAVTSEEVRLRREFARLHRGGDRN